MAKYVLLAFDNDADADSFIKFQADDPDLHPLDLAWFATCGEVVGVFKKPTQFCQCTPSQRAGKMGVRGSKYGWFVCGNCKKPAQNGNQVIFNMLEGNLHAWAKNILLQVRAPWETLRASSRIKGEKS